MGTTYRVVGLMSGTSLDGLDIAFCRFSCDNGQWSFVIEHAETISYPDDWLHALRGLPSLSSEAFVRTHVHYGTYLGEQVRDFLQRHALKADFVASHGHTIFHQPRNRFTFQAGDGASLAAASGLPVVFDFRSSDVALGGQGAPLVPVGDRLLFPDFDFCLNLGGIANISFERSAERIAFDISPCNLLLNHLASRVGKSFDPGGEIAAAGKMIPELLTRLDQVPFYGKSGPKSLGREDIERDFLPLLDNGMHVEDLLHTVSCHIAARIADCIKHENSDGAGRILVTGGGAWNAYLVSQIRTQSGAEVVVPEPKLVDFKEALVFAFLGALRWTGQVNVYRTVTGASADHCAGSVSLP